MSTKLEINYVKGDATYPQGPGLKFIIHICNNEGKWGRGFVKALSKRWDGPEYEFRKSYNDFGTPRVGDIQCIDVEPDIKVVNMIGQQGVAYEGRNDAPIRYSGVFEALKEVSKMAKEQGASVHMPRIGCGLAGGRWCEIEKMINKTLINNGVDVYVYEL